ncbi:MAG: hypothetical protein MI746_15655 [Pseudomonadales bacterium]|nr:hypothetical protein [Pseudomonadales bacterium]
MKHLILASLFTLVSYPAFSQDEEEGEVIVIAELNRAEVSQFIEEAEEQFYAIFNANVDDDDFKISCSRQTPTGSNISQRVCEPEFMNKARADNANAFTFNRGTELSENEIRTSLQPQFDLLQEKMQQMTTENPEFAQIANILTQLRARLNQLTN